jgi:hypothetical protein
MDASVLCNYVTYFIYNSGVKRSFCFGAGFFVSIILLGFMGAVLAKLSVSLR